MIRFELKASEAPDVPGTSPPATVPPLPGTRAKFLALSPPLPRRLRGRPSRQPSAFPRTARQARHRSRTLVARQEERKETK